MYCIWAFIYNVFIGFLMMQHFFLMIFKSYVLNNKEVLSMYARNSNAVDTHKMDCLKTWYMSFQFPLSAWLYTITDILLHLWFAYHVTKNGLYGTVNYFITRCFQWKNATTSFTTTLSSDTAQQSQVSHPINLLPTTSTHLQVVVRAKPRTARVGTTQRKSFNFTFQITILERLKLNKIKPLQRNTRHIVVHI